jgi:UPF0755 protein
VKPPEEFDESTVRPVVRRRRASSDGGDGTAPERPTGDDPTPGPTAPPDRSVERASATPARPVEQEPAAQDRPSQRSTASARAASGAAAPERATRERPAQERPAPARRGSSRPPTRAAAPPRRPPSDDDEYVLLPPPTSGGRRLLAVGGIVVLLVGLLVGGLLVWASRQVDPSGDPGEVVDAITVPSGASTDDIAALLADEGVISSARMFRYYVGWKGAGPWEAGQYVEFRQNSSFDEAIEVLDDGPLPAQASVVRIIEGTRLVDALAQIAEQVPSVTVEQLQAALDSGEVTSAYKPPEVASWEGLLFPDTYQFEEGASAQLILQTMATKMDQVLDRLGYERAEALRGRSAYELITIASLIEKETGAPPEERGMISRVISNRLDEGETLGIDASVLYGLGRTSGELTQTDLDTETPYNTRIVTGLPPTPIALPGEASLAAAIAPPEGTWRYYVLTSNDPPTHVFTDDYDEFLEARDDARERGVF